LTDKAIAIVIETLGTGLQTPVPLGGSWSFQDCIPKLELGNERN